METPAGHGPRSTARPSRTDVDITEFRHALGRFCTGVTVITALDGEPVGFTCQSFASLSLVPPMVTFFAANTSRTLPRLLSAGAFGANILRADQEAVARRFGAPHPDRFAGVKWLSSPVTGSPRLSGVLAWVEALVEGAVPGGDHTIVIGRVVGTRYGDGEPLLYFGGEFGLPGARTTS